MGDTLKILLGAMLAVGTGFLLNKIEISRQRNISLSAIRRELKIFTDEVKQLRALLTYINEITTLKNLFIHQSWLDSDSWLLLNRIKYSRIYTDENTEKMLSLFSESYSYHLIKFYAVSNALIQDLVINLKQRKELLDLAYLITRRNAVTNQLELIDNLTKEIPVELGLTDWLGKNILSDLEKLTRMNRVAIKLYEKSESQYSIMKKVIISFKCARYRF